ncbi:Ectonucleoside triphosphate diphosphohydrolase 5 [Fasciolopsis buskii]|uniref:Ectonucleoside triphosphate diphosphohydrolase 5 n=1 Tax=Fasciolopsis buskii TaxID=27845 RepID=A0A8E0RQJ5_9TREM|nr:Ectonucleoside triphosphate diphosphohydrolase 5 [Fasciolopsis buski]
MFQSDSELEQVSNSDLSPMLKRVLSSRVLYAVSLPPPRRKNGIWKIQNWIILGLIVSVLLMAWFTLRTSLLSMLYRNHRYSSAWNSMPVYKGSQNNEERLIYHSSSGTPNTLYGVVIDAGSTGTRVHVFELRRSINVNPNQQFTLTREVFEHVQPGLSAYADHPEQAAESLTPLLRIAEENIPNDTCHSTSVVVRATAGLRLLPSFKADSILDAVRRKLTTSCLLSSNNSVSILDGNQEGLYLWTSLNFMTNRMPIPNTVGRRNPNVLSRTVGTLDLGGGSTQITFAPTDSLVLAHAPPGYVTEVRTGRSIPPAQAQIGSEVYSHSYLGLGLMSARYSILTTATKRLPFETYPAMDSLYSPCFTSSLSANWSHAGKSWHIQPLPQSAYRTILLPHEEAASVRSFTNFAHVSPITKYCYAHALLVLRDPVEGDNPAHIFQPHGYVVHRPNGIEHQEFYAFSYIFDLAISVGIVHDHSGGTVTVSQFRDAAEHICLNPDPKKPFECMDLCFITALLHDGYGFPWTKQITLQKKVNTFEISWGLGALFAELGASEVT